MSVIVQNLPQRDLAVGDRIVGIEKREAHYGRGSFYPVFTVERESADELQRIANAYAAAAQGAREAAAE